MSVELIHTSDNVLTAPERRALEVHEEVIERGIQTFMEVGHRLQEIRDARLYRERYSTFEAYCKERWGWSRVQAHRLIKASDTVSNLLPTGNAPAPTSERQVRPLTKLKTSEEQYEAWCKAHEIAEEENKPVTGKIVQRAVEEVSKPKDKNESQTISNADVERAVNEGTADKAITWVNEIDLNTHGAKYALNKVINHCNKLLQGATK